MSEVTLFQQTLPDYLKNVEVDEMTRSLAGGSIGSKRISLKGGAFRLVVGGKEIARNDNNSMNVVFVAGNPKVSRTFYGSAYDPKVIVPPDCWSNDGIVPDPSSEKPQHTSCEGCPQNIKGSAPNNSRACKFKQRLAVVLADDISGDVYGLELASKSIFATSPDIHGMGFQQYVKYVAAQGKNLNNLVTEMKFNKDGSVATLTFKAVKYLEQHEWQTAVAKGKSSEAKQAIKMSFSKKEDSDKESDNQEVVQSKPAEDNEPKKRKSAEPAPKKDLTSVIGDWATDDE